MEEKVIWNSSADNNYNEEEVMLPGFRFHPTDEELVGFYLRRKVEKKPVSFELIKQIDLYKYDPWDLPKISDEGEKEWYFFCVRGRKYRNSIRPNRVTGSGFWKATGIDKPISNLESNQCIGLKKSLVYYRGSAGKGTKTDWMMHEFRLPPSRKNIDHPNPNNIISQEAEVWTLCRIFRRNASCKKYKPECKYSSGTQTATDERSKTCSIMSENNEQYTSHRNLIAEENRRMSTPAAFNPKEKRNQPFTGDHNTPPYEEDPFTKSYPCLWKPNNDEFLGVGKWDELRSVVDLGIDPSSVYGYI